MLAFDIETTGLKSSIHKITVAAVYDPDAGVKKVFNFITDYDDSKEGFLRCLDDAESLCSFNGLRFDIPFIVHTLNVPRKRYEPWILKLFDFFEVCKGLYDSSCSLNNLLAANGHGKKVGSGLEAIAWYQDEDWDRLENYCMEDTILTHTISTCIQSTCVLLPLSSGIRAVVCRAPHMEGRLLMSCICCDAKK